MKKSLIAVAVLFVMVLGLAACGKMTEPFKDAERAGVNDSPATTVTFPDGFNNAATKCDNGNRVYVLYHADSPYGGIAVVPQDPTCK